MILSKRRSADENIGKLILFSITIIIAVGLASLFTFFYQDAKKNEIYLSVLLDVRSTIEDINSLDGFDGCTSGVEHNAITGLYSISGCSSIEEDIKGITYTSDSIINNTIIYMQK